MTAEPTSGIDLAKARLDPGSVFRGPEEVVGSHELAREEKLDLLRRWEYDARELAVAEDEGMGGGEATLLDRIEAALNALLGRSACADPTDPDADRTGPA